MTDRLLTLLEFGKILAKSERSVRRIVNAGEISAYRIGASMRVRESDVDAFIESRRIDSGTHVSGLKNLGCASGRARPRPTVSSRQRAH